MRSAHTNKILGVVLVGGQSSRMGSNKALLSLNGRPLVDHMVDLLHEAGIEEVRLSGVLERYDSIPDRSPFEGPLSAIYSVIQAVRDEPFSSLLILPVDMPSFTVELLLELIKTENSVDAICYESKPLPLLLHLSNKLPQTIEKILKDQKRASSIKNLLNDIETERLTIPPSTSTAFKNINTPSEWRSLHSRP